MDGTTAPPSTRAGAPARAGGTDAELGAEVRESLLLLGLTAAVTGLVALSAHVALVLLG
jgi:hypothetical protein